MTVVNRWGTIGLAVLILAVPVRADAHPRLLRSNPVGSAVLTAVPKRITLEFSESVEILLTRATLILPSGDSLGIKDFRGDSAGGRIVSAEISGIDAPGNFRVMWSTMGSDGHAMRGSFAFSVRQPLSPAEAPIQTQSSTERTQTATLLSEAVNADGMDAGDSGGVSGAAARAVTFAGILVLLGSMFFRFIVLPRAGVDSQAFSVISLRTAYTGVAASLAVLLSCAARTVTESRTMAAVAGSEDFSTGRMLSETHWGAAMQLQMMAAVVALAGLLVARRAKAGWLFGLIGGVGAALAASLGGHAGSAAQFRPAAIAADFTHLVAASGWIGNLTVLCVAGLPVSIRGSGDTRWQRVAGMVNAFSPVALASTAIIVITGLFAAWIQLGRLENLWLTDYGKVLLVKVAFFCATVGIGGYNFLRVKRSLGSEAGARRLERSAGAEILVACLILAVTGLLTGISVR